MTERSEFMRGMIKKFEAPLFALRLTTTLVLFGVGELAPERLENVADSPSVSNPEDRYAKAVGDAKEAFEDLDEFGNRENDERAERDRETIFREAALRNEPEIAELLSRFEVEREEVKTRTDALTAKDAREYIQELLKTEQTVELQKAMELLHQHVKEDAEKAAASLEDLDITLANEIERHATEAPQETDQLLAKFGQEKTELVDKLNTIEEKYFDRHPDLTEDQRVDATERFKAVKGEALGSLEAQQQVQLLELEHSQDEASRKLAEAKDEVEQTRDERH